MAKFSQEQRIFIIKSFARNTSPAKVRREFLMAHKIQGRLKSRYTLKDFCNVNEHFESTGSTVITLNKKRLKMKRTAENLEKINELLAEKTTLSVRKIAPKLTISATSVWRILRYDSKARFYHSSSVQPLG